MNYRDLKPPRGDQVLFLLGTRPYGWPRRDKRHHLLYEIRVPKDKNGYVPNGDGDVCWTTKKKGPAGEAIERRRRFTLSEGEIFISSFEDWELVLEIFRGTQFELDEFEYSRPSRKGGKT